MARFEHLDPSEIKDRLTSIAEYGQPGPESAEMVDVGTGHYLGYFEREVLQEFILFGGATCRFYEGPYGAGKSHLLQLLSAAARRHGFATVDTELGRAVNLEDWRAVTKHVLRHMEMVIEGETVISFPAIIERLGRKGRACIQRLNDNHLPHPGLKRAMSLIAGSGEATRTAKELLKGFLLGERTTVSDLRRNGVRGIKGPLTHKNAEQFLTSALSGLHHLTSTGTVLFFDENEKSFVSNRWSPSQKIRQSANLMRRLIDSCMSGGMPGTVTIFAVLPDFLENCANAYPALGQRLETDLLHATGPGWRSPVLTVEQVSVVKDPTGFTEEAIGLFARIVKHCDGARGSCDETLRSVGMAALEAHAGANYRRAVMKALALAALRHLGEV